MSPSVKDGTRKQNGHWRNFANVESELKPIIEQLQHFPTQNELESAGQLSLVTAIAKYHGGFPAVRKRLGHALIRQPHGHWKDIANVTAKLTEIIGETNEFPTQQQLATAGYTGLVDAITDYHGGLGNIRQSMGYDEKIKPSGYWTLERTLQACQELVKDGKLPTQKELTAMQGEYRGIIGAVAKHGGLRKLNKITNIGRTTVSNTTELFAELSSIVKNIGYLPTHKQLRSMGRGDLSGAITKMTNQQEIINALNLTPESVPSHPVMEHAILEECRKVIKQYGDLPSADKLKELGYTSLASSIHYKGGYHHFRKKLGLEGKIKMSGHWREWENVAGEFQNAMNTLGHFPSHKELLAYKSTLPGALVKYHGGLPAARERFLKEKGISEEGKIAEILQGYLNGKTTQLETLLRSYSRS